MRSSRDTVPLSVLAQNRQVIGYIYQLPVLQIWRQTEVTPFFANFLSFPDLSVGYLKGVTEKS